MTRQASPPPTPRKLSEKLHPSYQPPLNTLATVSALREKHTMIFRARSRCAIALAFVTILASVRAPADIVWTGLGVNTNWTTGANWQGGSAPLNDGTEQIVFGTSTNSIVV